MIVNKLNQLLAIKDIFICGYTKQHTEEQVQTVSQYFMDNLDVFQNE